MQREILEEGLLPPASSLVEAKHKRQFDENSSATPVVLFSSFIALCGSFAFGCCSGFTSPAESGILKDLGISIAAYSVFASLMTVGGLTGALVSGKIADLIGRRGTMWLSDLFFILGWLAIVFSKGAWSLDLGRILLGIGSGLILYVASQAPIYVAEITPKKNRGALTSAFQLMSACGCSLIYVLGNVFHWRILALIAIVPCLVHFFGLFFIPESPRWLAKIDRHEELHSTLQRLRGKDVDIAQEAASIKEFTKTFQSLSEDRIFNLFHRRYAYPLIVGVGLMSLQQLGGVNSITYYASSIFEKVDFSRKVGTISLAIIQIPTVFASMILTDRTGRRSLLMFSATGMCLSGFVIGLSFCLQNFQQWEEISSNFVYVGILVYILTHLIGMGPLPTVIMSEIFPINIKGPAGSLLIVVNNISEWTVTYSFNFMMEWSAAATFFIFSGICGLTVLFIAKLVPETKGRTLEEIQASMTQFHEQETQDVI